MPALSTGIISLPFHFYCHEPKLLEQPEEWFGRWPAPQPFLMSVHPDLCNQTESQTKTPLCHIASLLQK